MKLDLSANPQAFAQQMQAEARRIAKGIRRGVAATTAEVKEELRSQIRSGSFRGERVLANAWRSRVYPERDNGTWKPAGLVTSAAPQIHQSLDRGSPITARGGKYLAIPSSINRIPGGRGQAMRLRVTPQQMTPGAGAFFLKRKNGPGLLWCLTVTGNRGGRGQGRVSINTGGVALFTGRGKGRAANIRAALDRGWVVMFTLVPSVQPRKVLDIEGVRRSIPARLLRNISAALA
jgi:hypothetical protein